MERPQAFRSLMQAWIAGQWVAPNAGFGRKKYMGIDEESLEVRAVEVTISSVSPSRQISCRNRLSGNARSL